MTIRITGMNSNLDTDSIVKELVKASSDKKNSLVKAQTKLSWKQDAWKSMNSKIYSFYNGLLDNLSTQGNFKKKKTTLSDSSIASVVGNENAVNGSQTLAVKQLAKAGYLTGGRLSENKSVKGSTTLSELSGGAIGSGDEIVLNVKNAGKDTEIRLNGSSSINDVMKQIGKTGLTANYDEANQRIYIASSGSGTANDFSITAKNAGGLQALSSMGLLTQEGINNNAEYQAWAAMYAGTDAEIEANADFQTKVKEISAERAKTIMDSLTSAKNVIDSLRDERTKIQDSIDQAKASSVYIDADGTSTADKLDKNEKARKAVDDKLRYLELTEKAAGSEGLSSDEQDELNVLTQKSTDDGWTMPPDKDQLETEKTSLENTRAVLDNVSGLENQMQANLDSSKRAQEDMANNALALKDYYDGLSASGDLGAMTPDDVAAVQSTIQDMYDYAVSDAADVGMTIPAAASYNIKDDVTAESLTQVKTAYAAVNSTITGPSLTAVRVMGQDAKISLNGADYVSDTNSFTVNGLTITANKLSDVTGTDASGNPIYAETAVNTSDDVDGIYDMIKGFFDGYNELMKEMDTMYNAASSKGYEPLTDEEKDAMTDSEVEAWEKKIKDSVLRRDPALQKVMDTMKMAMLQSYEIDGKTYSLASFGIGTLGYFNSADNERGCYHINGDPDDPNTSGQSDELKKMIASDPDVVMKFFSKMATSMHEQLNEQMHSTEYRTVYHVYDDKKMQSEYDGYKSKIKAQENKLKDLEDRYYNQFTAMEVALAKLNSQQSALSGLLGG